jgi:hypothetical protein
VNWCVIKHKWEYKTEDIDFFSNITRLKTNVTIPTKVRLCTRCYKKQRSRGIDWVDWELTIEEERDMKLKSIFE